MSLNSRKTGLSIILLLFAILLLGGGNQVIANESTGYKFGVFPFMPMAALLKRYQTVSTDFTQQVKERVIVQTRPTFRQFSDEIKKETYDIIFIQPFDYPMAYEHNYRPLARRIDNLDAILVTKIDSNFQSINDLAGKTLANPPIESAISILIKKEFVDAGLVQGSTVKLVYKKNHFACIQMVVLGKADACSTTTPVLRHWQNSGLKKKRLKVIHRAKVVPHTLFMVHKRVDLTIQEKFMKAILTFDERPQGKIFLKQFALKSFVEAKNEDYDVIRNYSN